MSPFALSCSVQVSVALSVLVLFIMSSIATYVFLDLECTGLPVKECNTTKITELSVIAVKHSHILQTEKGKSPRVQQKLTLCFNPGKAINPSCSKVTGLDNFLLEHETPFNVRVFKIINNFLRLLVKPVCLIAHNGMSHDYPILKKHLDDIGVSFSNDLMCADSLFAIYDIMNEKESQKVSPNGSFSDKSSQEETGVDEVDLMWQQNALDMQKQNETTPKKSTASTSVMKTPRKEDSKPYARSTPKKSTASTSVMKTPRKEDSKPYARVSNVPRKPFFFGPKPDKSYKLKNIYKRLLRRPAISAHWAEYDCLMVLECCVAISTKFVQWVDENHSRFADVKSMTAGVKPGF